MTAEAPRCPNCLAWLNQSRHQPLILATIDPRIRWAVECPGCSKNWIVTLSLWQQRIMSWNDAVEADLQVEKEVDHPIDWAEIDRMREKGMIR